MNFRAILSCRNCKDNLGRSTKDTALFYHEGQYTPSIRDAQNVLDSMVDIKCDKCSENDWRVLEVQQVQTRGN